MDFWKLGSRRVCGSAIVRIEGKQENDNGSCGGPADADRMSFPETPVGQGEQPLGDGASEPS